MSALIHSDGQKCTYRSDVESTEDQRQDPRSNEDAPHGQTQRLLTCRLFVQVAQHVESYDNHSKSKKDKAVVSGKEWPVSCEISIEDVAFRNDQEETRYSRDDVTAAVEEEELAILLVTECMDFRRRSAYLGDLHSLDQHDDTCYDHGEQGNDVQGTDNVKNDVA